jgi:rubrerythrin
LERGGHGPPPPRTASEPEAEHPTDPKDESVPVVLESAEVRFPFGMRKERAMEEQKEALAALETGIQMELEGHRYYVKAAERVSWPEGQQTLLALAKDEMEHIKILERQHAALLAGQDWLRAETVAPRLASGEKTPLPVFEKDDAVIAGMVDDRADALDVLDVAIKNEYKSHTFYAGLVEKTRNPEARAIFAWLVKEEKGHQATLTEYAKYLGAHQEWLLERERPILEG